MFSDYVQHKETPLGAVARRGNLPMVKLLLEKKAKVDAPDMVSEFRAAS